MSVPRGDVQIGTCRRSLGQNVPKGEPGSVTQEFWLTKGGGVLLTLGKKGRALEGEEGGRERREKGGGGKGAKRRKGEEERGGERGGRKGQEGAQCPPTPSCDSLGAKHRPSSVR